MAVSRPASPNRPRYAEPSSPIDWIFGLICILAGFVGLRIAGNSATWSKFAESDSKTARIAMVSRAEGRVRFRRVQSSVWQDLDAPVAAAEGDAVATGPNGIAWLSFPERKPIQILPNSLIIVHLDPPAPEKPSHEESWWNRISRTVGQAVQKTLVDAPEGETFLEVKRGRVGITLDPEAPTLKLVANKRVFRLENSSGSGTIDLNVDPRAKGDPIRLVARDGAQPKIASADGAPRPLGVRIERAKEASGASFKEASGASFKEASGASFKEASGAASELSREPATQAQKPPLPRPPEILSPVHEARFPAGDRRIVGIALRWKPVPEGLRPQVEVEFGDGPRILDGPEVTRAGLTLDLPIGHYRWRARTTHAQGAHSEWSPWLSFAIERKIAPEEPVALLKFKAAPDPVSYERYLEKERVERERRAQAAAQAARRKAEADETRKAWAENAEPTQHLREEQRRQAAEREMERAKLRVEEKRREEARRKEEEQRLALEKLRAEEKAARLKKYADIIAAAQGRIQDALQNTTTITTRSVAQASLREPSSIAQQSSSGSTRLGAEAKLDELRVRLEWKPLPWAKSYEVTVFRQSKPYETKSVPEPAYDLVLKTYDPGIRYSYQVATTLPNGKEVKSEVTPVEIEIAPPVLAKPNSGAVFTKNQPLLFSWARTVLTDEYQFELARDPEFTQLIEQKREPINFRNTAVSGPGTYYWRVKSISKSFESGWSAVRTIRVE